jgi:hypothetical protein
LVSDIEGGTRRVLRRTSGSNRQEVTAGRGKLHNEELHNLYGDDQIKEDENGWDNLKVEEEAFIAG